VAVRRHPATVVPIQETPFFYAMITRQITLVPVTKLHKIALKLGKSHLHDMLGVTIPEGWPQFPEAFEVRDEDSEDHELWPSYFFVCPAEGALVGNGGFAAPPNDTGEVEIGYEIAPAFQNRGYATRAVGLLCDFAFSRSEIGAVVAHTLAEENASNAVLKKLGFSMVAELPNSEVGKVWKWSIQRATWCADPDQ
jgi:RimJ/RimL family protein N-acetyltransferase